MIERNIDKDAVASCASRQRFLEFEYLRDEEAAFPPFALRVDEPRDGAETNVRMLVTASRESPNDSAASVRVSGWSGNSAVEKGFGTPRVYHGCARGVAVKKFDNRIACRIPPRRFSPGSLKPTGASTLATGRGAARHRSPQDTRRVVEGGERLTNGLTLDLNRLRVSSLRLSGRTPTSGLILHLDVKNDDGSIVGWTVETLPARGVMSRGLDRDFIN